MSALSEKTSCKKQLRFLTVDNESAPALAQRGVRWRFLFCFVFFSPSQSVTCDKYQGSGLNMGGLLGSLTVLQEVQYRVQTAVSPQQQRVQVSGSGPELNRVLISLSKGQRF